MLHLNRARVPSAVLPSPLAAKAAGPMEPTVLCDVRIEGDRITSVEASAAAPGGDGDLAGAIVFPGFVDAHVHLDKTHTWDRSPNGSGTFADALETLHRDAAAWTHEDLRRRAGFALHCAWERGTRVIRTHVDTWLPGGEAGHEVMAELRDAWRGRIELQTVPLAGIATLAAPGGEALVDLALRHGAVAIGGWSPLTRELPGQLDRLLAMAAERRIGLDLHVDENGRPGEEVLRAVAQAVLRNGFAGPVVCGHCCSLSVQEPERQRATIALVREAAIRVISLPLCNLYLQDRRLEGFPRSPQWRGLAPVRDLMDAGIPVACASDNVRDAFYAYGDYDAAEVLIESVRLAHLDSRLADAPGVVTRTAADIVGAEGMGRVAPGARAHLVVFPARSMSEFLSRPGSPRRLVDGERVREARPPDYSELG